MKPFTGFKLDIGDCEPFLAAGQIDALAGEVARVAADLQARRGPGADRLGWLDPEAAAPAALRRSLLAAARRARADCEAYVVVGIGGSYLGARALLEALGSAPGAPELLFAGHHLCSVSLRRLLDRLQGRELRLCVISKSGGTLEPAVAFRILRAMMCERYGREGAARRITAVTGAQRGVLRRLADEEGYETFAVPEDIGGRFSVLSPVGLLPLAVAGVDIDGLLAGAARMRDCSREPRLRANAAHLYAAARHALYQRGYRLEVLSAFHGGLHYLQEWWKQLFGESEGKDGKGIFPAAAAMTADLHSLGQYLQDGRRELLETFLAVKRGAPEIVVTPEAPPAGQAAGAAAAADRDGLGYLAGRPLDEINWLAYQGTRRAHAAGGVPCLALELDALTPETAGGLVYFFELAVAVSGRLLNVNPFDQPGVEAYKREIYRLLGRPE